MELRGGEGGEDSKLFVEDLFSAYMKYSESLGFKSEILDSDFGHIVAKVAGNGVGEAFKNEIGKHVVQRIPPTESKGRKQTSIVVVGILPIKDDLDIEPLKSEDLEVICQRGSGPGGQNKNKTDSAVRMKHMPTGISVFICNERSQQSNKYEALKILTAKVNEAKFLESNSNYSEIRKNQLGDGGRSDKIRTYNFLESRVVDHRLGTKTGNIKAIMKGEFKLLFR